MRRRGLFCCEAVVVVTVFLFFFCLQRTTGFDLYVIFDPLISKTQAILLGNKLIQWIDVSVCVCGGGGGGGGCGNHQLVLSILFCPCRKMKRNLY